ncbi:hypothetical protein MMC13_002323 [Lambiella insularis]|nr:hypothetical protein [Lambiella insularis]
MAVNGEKSPSQFISHITSYPVVADSISTFKSNPYGQKSIDIADHGYKSIVAPVLPYAEGPYGYVKPYVAKADELATDGLTRVDKTFPIVKQDAEQIKSTVLDAAFMPLRMAFQTKDYVFQTYGKEYKRCGGDGLVAGGKAMITTGLVVTSDTLSWLSTFLGEKKEEAKSFAKEKTNN